MDIDTAASGFAAIGAPVRLDMLLMLVRAGMPGLTVGEIQERSGLPASTLAHHLRALVDGGLVDQERQGRSVITRARFDQLQTLGSYLLRECCSEQAITRENAA